MIRYKAAAAALVLAAFGCGLAGASPKPGAKPPSDLQGLGISSGRNILTQPDPKNLKWTMWKLNVAGFSGAAVSNGFQGTVEDVHATLFKQGKPVATVTAPKATGNSVDRILVATGGILVISLAEKGTQLRADHVIWYARTNKIVAEGHVVYRNGKSGMTASGPIFVADTALKTIRSSSPGRVSWPKGF